ncbi:MAG: hypothetical protein Q8N06_02910 [Hydrogenophaga sp.]|nr:hypothetical protein [Hydrogenophaga sp.]
MNLPTLSPAAAVITPDTPIMFAGQAGATIAMDAVSEIQSLAAVLQKLSLESTDAVEGFGMHALVVRINALNSLVMSYLSGEGEELTLAHYGREMFGWTLGRDYVRNKIEDERDITTPGPVIPAETTRIEWEAGRDVAASMFRKIADTLRTDGGAGMYIEGENRYRQVGDIKTLPYPDGVQDNVCAAFMSELLERPALLPGFAAVLTDFFFQFEENAVTPDHHAIARTPYEEWIKVPEDEDGVRTSTRLDEPPAVSQGVLSAQAIADIDAHILRTGGLIELFLGGGGDADAALVNILDFSKYGFEKVKGVTAFDDAWHRIVEAESLLQAAVALAEDSKGTSQMALALLSDLMDAADALSQKFDGGGVHYVAYHRPEARPAVVRSLKEAVPA